MNIMITGGAGFIGTNFTYYMVNKYKNYNITVLDKLTYAGKRENLAPIESEIRFIKADIADKDAVCAAFESVKPDIVVNFAAESHVDRSIENPGIFLKTNILGTQTLMDACIKYGVERFHQISTDEVYGDLPLDRADLSFDESSPIRASSPYSASKASADLLVSAYVRTYGLNATISRCSNNYGPYQFPEKLIPLVISRARENKPVPLYGNGLNVRDWIYAEDHCCAVDMIIHSGKAGEVYNVGARAEMANIDVIKTVLSLMGKDESLITYVEDRKGHDLRYALNPAKIQTTLGWQSKTDFKTGIKKTVNWYLERF
ncbi:MAG: dTDP-glucose 4,6-dehydratase [Firmicutes bacterium]|nr:dTDP-glucose 4,6-dehydratase [Bacillota bacterium]